MTIVTLVKLNTESRLLIGPAHKQDHFPSDDGLDAATRTFEAIQRRCRSSFAEEAGELVQQYVGFHSEL
jgi:hypothetical protein